MKLTNKCLFLTFLAAGNGMLSAAPDFTRSIKEHVSVNVHGNLSAGVSDNDDLQRLHAHDPDESPDLQGLEVGVNVSLNSHVEGFLNLNAFIIEQGDIDGELEEGFLKFKNLPLDMEVRGGRYLNRIGTENQVHLHGWEFVNANLSTAKFLGEEGVRTEGVELSWIKELAAGEISISGSYGKVVSHEHHGDEHEDEHDEDEHDDHEDDDHEDEGHEDDDHGDHEGQELAYFSDRLLSVRAQVLYNITDFYQHKLGFNFAEGENGYGRDTSLMGADYVLTWRENGIEKGGREVSAGVEYLYRDVEWQDEHDASHVGATTQQSLAVRTTYTWNENWKLAARYEWIEGVSTEHGFSMEEYKRASLAVTHRRQLSDDWSGHARLQYNHDKTAHKKSNNLFFQLGFSFGKKEIR